MTSMAADTQTSEQIPQVMAAWMLDKGLGPIAFLLVVNVLLLLAGNVMEPSSIVLIMAPIMFPIAMKLGIDPVHFGVIMVFNLAIGMLTPPVGICLMVASSVSKEPMQKLIRPVLPFLGALLVVLALVTYVPEISLYEIT